MQASSKSLAWAFAYLAVTISGCGRGGVGATAVGVLKIDGQPAPAGIRVDFQPQGEQGSPSMGITDAKGRYELFFTAARKGVMPGECVVRLSIVPEYTPEGIPKPPDALKHLVIPEIYDSKPTLTRTIKPGHNQIDIEITTAALPTKPTRP